MSRAGRPRKPQPNKRRDSPKLDAWRRSARCKDVAVRALEKARAVMAARPRCGAKRKRDGEPCQRPALLPSKRCRLHGASTPRGNDWHRIRKPAKGEHRGLERFEAKLVAKEKLDRKRAQRLAAMTPEERKRHDEWQQTHTPGPASKRAHRRQQLATKAMLDKLLATKEQQTASDDLGVFG